MMETTADSATDSNSGIASVEKAVQGKVVGVIIPPPEIRAVVDKTALFVGRNGKSFEQRILSSSEGQTAKFNFMRPFDPYHAYYEMKIKEVEDGVTANNGSEESKQQRQQGSGSTGAAPVSTAAEHQQSIAASTETSRSKAVSSSSGAGGARAQVSTTAVKATLLNPIALLAREPPPDTAPPPLKFLLQHPTAASAAGTTSSSSSSSGNRTRAALAGGTGGAVVAGLSAEALDVIKLTAQFTAVNGREFLSKLAVREQRNPEFAFLQPTNALFAYFTALVDAYGNIVHPSRDMRSEIKKRMLWKQAAALSVQRWQWHRAEEKRRLSSAEGAGGEGLLDADRLAAAAIDWSDFAVVETINFEPDELLPGEPGYVGGAPAPVPAPAPATVSMKSRTGTGAGLAAAVPPPPTAPTAPSYFAPQSVAEQPHGEAVGGEGEEEGVNVGGMEVEEEDISDLKVVSDYTYDIAATGGGGGGGSSASGRGAGVGAMVRDPISGKIVPAAELSEHMRVQLLDPQWREQQKRFEEKQRETGYAEGGSIADSLRQFARKRGDIFGQAANGSSKSKDSAAAIAKEEEEEKQRQMVRGAVQWDGHHGSAASARHMKQELVSNLVVAGATSALGPSSSMVRGASAGIQGIGPTTARGVAGSAAPTVAPVAPTPAAAPAAAKGAKAVTMIPPPPPPVAPVVTPLVAPPPPPPPPVVASTAPAVAVPVPAVPATGPLAAAVLPPPPPAVPAAPTEPSAKKARTSELATPTPPPPRGGRAAAGESENKQAGGDAVDEKEEKGDGYEEDEEAFLARYSVRDFMLRALYVQLPQDSSVPAWNLHGQRITIGTDSGGSSGGNEQQQLRVTDPVKALKDAIAQATGMPANKQQLRIGSSGPFLKDAATLASLLLGDGCVLELTVKSRGGRR